MHAYPRLLAIAMALAAAFRWGAASSGQDDAAAPSATAGRDRDALASDGRAAPQAAEDLPLDLREADSAKATAPAASPGKYLLRAVLNLAIVVALIYGIFFGARLWRQARSPQRGGGAIIEVLDAANIDADKTVYIVALGAKTVVLGGSGTQLTLICELDDAEAACFRKDAERTALPDGADA